MKRLLTIGGLLLAGPACSDIIELEPTVVIGDRLSEDKDAQEGANGISLEGGATILGADVLEKSSNSFLSELLEAKAGVSFDSFFGNSSLAAPRLRGFGESSQLRTLVTVDGLPINRSDLALNPWSRTPLGDLEKVTVLRGGRSVRYGSGAVAGVIALETKRSTEAFEGSLEGAAGSDETFRQRLSLRGNASGWGWTTQLENFSSDSYRENSEQETTSGSVSLRSPEAHWGENRLTFSASRSRFEDPGPLGLDAFREDPRQSLQPDQFLESDTVTLANQLKINLGADWRLELKGAGSATRREVDNQRVVSDGDSQSWDGELVLVRTGEEWSFETGARFQRSELDFERSQPFGSGTDQQLADLSREVWGGFLIVRWEPTDELSLSVGASWDHYRLDGDARSPNDAENPRRNFSGDADDSDYAFELGVEYQLADGVKIWGRYDRSLRFPVLDEVAFFQGFESDLPFNAELNPERGQGVEIGIVVNDEEAGWEASVTLFGQWMEDEIFFDAFSNENENLAETERLGVEVELEWEADCWSANLFYAATLARFRSGVDDGRRVPLVSRHSVSGTLTWHLAENLDVGVEGSYLSARSDGNDRNNQAVFGSGIQFREIPERVVWNLTSSWDVNDSLTLFCRVNNVFDESYISTQFSGGIYPGVGRQALFGGRIQF